MVRAYARSLRLFVLPELRAVRLSDLRRGQVQALVDGMVGNGRSGSEIAATVMPLRAIVRRAIERDELTVNPLVGVRLPKPGGPRERAANPGELAELLEAAPRRGARGLRGCGLRGATPGELRGLQWADIDFDTSEIRVARSWDDRDGEIAPKSRAGLRVVPLVPTLRLMLLEHRMRSGHADAQAFVFPSPRDRRAPFTASAIRRRAERAWENSNAARVEPVLQGLAPDAEKEQLHVVAVWLVRFRLDRQTSTPRSGSRPRRRSGFRPGACPRSRCSTRSACTSCGTRSCR